MENTASISAKTKTENTAAAATAAASAATMLIAPTPLQTAAEKIFEKNLHEKFALYGKNAREWTRKCTLLLPEIEKREIWKKRGFSSIYEYATKLAGMSRATVDAALWTLRKIEDKPALMAVVEEKGIESVRPIANLATMETANLWANHAREMSRNTLAVYAKEFRKIQNLQNPSCAGAEIPTTPQMQNITMELEPKVAQKLEKLKGQGDWNALMKQFIEMREKQLEQQKPQPIENAARYVPAAIKKHALAKTNGACAFPGCTKPYEILHHTERFALTHAHNPDTLVPLCLAHERLAHLGLIENEEKPPSEWRIKKQPGRPYENSEKYKIDQKILKYRAAAARLAG